MARLEILLVDDDPLIRHVIADELEEAGHFVTVTASAESALQLLREKGAFDLVLTDYTLPGLTGSALVRQILDLLPNAKTAILTGFAQLPPGDEAPCPVITKGVRMSELIKAVEAAAAGQPVHLAYNAMATRLDLLVDHMRTEPAVSGVKNAMHEAFDSKEGDAMPDAIASVLDRLPPET